jgi:hypothetical protein
VGNTPHQDTVAGWMLMDENPTIHTTFSMKIEDLVKILNTWDGFKAPKTSQCPKLD